jgi:hypothetical protein
LRSSTAFSSSRNFSMASAGFSSGMASFYFRPSRQVSSHEASLGESACADRALLACAPRTSERRSLGPCG